MSVESADFERKKGETVTKSNNMLALVRLPLQIGLPVVVGIM